MDGFLDVARCYSFCDICKTGYDADYHAPMALPCLHAVCRKCLMGASEQMIECPKCKLAPSGPRISAESIKEDAFRKRICKSLRISRNEIPCTDCPDSAKADSYCTECQIFMCTQCMSAHGRTLLTRNHRLETPVSDPNCLKDNRSVEKCSIAGHEQEVIEYFCEYERCQGFICRLCLDHHRQVDGHVVLTLHDSVSQSKHEIRALLGNLEETVTDMNATQTKINREILAIEIKENEALRDVEMAVGTFRRVLELKYQDLRDIIRSRFQEHRKTVEPILQKIQHFQMMVDFTNTFLSCVESEANAVELLPMKETIVNRLRYLQEYRVENNSLQTFDLKIETQPVEEVKRFVSSICRLITHQSNNSSSDTQTKNRSNDLSLRERVGRNERPLSINLNSVTEKTSTYIPRAKLASEMDKAISTKTRSLSDNTDSRTIDNNSLISTMPLQSKSAQLDDKSPTNKTTNEINGRPTRLVLQSPRSYASPKVDISPKLPTALSEKSSPILNRTRSTSVGNTPQRQKLSPTTPRRWSPPSSNLSKLPSPVRREMNSFFSAKSTSQNEKSNEFNAKKELKFSDMKSNDNDTENIVQKTKPIVRKPEIRDFSDLYEIQADDSVGKPTLANSGIFFENHTNQSSTVQSKNSPSNTVLVGDITCPEILMDASMVHEERRVSNNAKTLSNRQPKASTGESDEEDGFFLYKGTVGTYSFKEVGKFYFEVHVVYSVQQPLEQTWMVFEIGMCRLDDIDRYHSVERHPNARSFYVARYPEDGKLTQEFWHNRQLLEYITLSSNTSGVKIDIVYGHLVDTRKKTWTVINCTKNKALFTFKEIDFSVPLFPVFGTYNPELVAVELTLRTGTDAEPKKILKILNEQSNT